MKGILRPLLLQRQQYLFDLQRLKLSLSLRSETIFEFITRDLLTNANLTVISRATAVYDKPVLYCSEKTDLHAYAFAYF